MKLTLIKPNMGRMADGPYVDEGRMEPLQLGVIAGLTPPDVELRLLDDRMEAIDYETPTDLVALTVETFTARRSYEIADSFRQRGVPVVLGGMHPTFCPEEASAHADTVVTGDAESLWAGLVEDARRGKLKQRYAASAGPPQPGTFTRRDLFEGKGYLPVTLLQYSRGCRFQCNFCAISSYFDARQYHRRIDEVLEEIHRQKRDLLFFVDDNIVSHPEAAKELFRELIPLKIRWVSQGSLDMTQDLELMDLMVRSGCLGNVIGFESVTPAGLRLLKKSPNLASFNDYREPVQILRDHGLQTWAAFVLGHDEETEDSIQRTVDFALENKFCFAAFNIMMPYPTTPLYHRLQGENRLLFGGRWWLHPDYRFNHAAFHPKTMTHHRLTELCFAARSRWNSWGSIIRRLSDVKTNLRTLGRMGIFLRYNSVFRKETFKKQGLFLGEKKGSPEGRAAETNPTLRSNKKV